jgi:hypothetical protein
MPLSDHDLLVRIDEKVDNILKVVSDHEGRIRSLEEQQHKWLGRDGVIAAILGLIAGAVSSLTLWLSGGP